VRWRPASQDAGASYRSEALAAREWRGIVDVIAIRKDTSHSDHELLKSGDLLDIILIQTKGGSDRRFIVWLSAASGWAEAVEAGPVGALPRRVVQRSCVDAAAAAALQPA